MSQPVVNSWVQLVNNSTSVAYLSTAVTTGTGLFTVLGVPAGSYTVNISTVSNTGPWTATGNANYYIGADVNSGNTFNATQTISGGNLSITTASGKIIAGPSQLLFRNNADNATNVSVGDGGLVTIRNGLIVSAGGVTASSGGSTFTTITASGEVSTTDVKVTGIGQFTQTSRFLGAMTVTGPPNTGAYQTGDWGFDANGTQWFCTAGGSPGTWVTPRILAVNGAAPTVTGLNANISTATLDVRSTDNAGTITFTSTNNISAGSNLMTVNFAKAFTNPPVVVCQGGPQFLNSFNAIAPSPTSFTIFNVNSMGAASGQGITYIAMGK